jgi:regulator of nonsense transcripts 1
VLLEILPMRLLVHIRTYTCLSELPLLHTGMQSQESGVIKPHKEQSPHIPFVLGCVGTPHAELYKEIEVTSVDMFQGRKMDFIISSCVRSNEKQGIEFLNNRRWLNVVLNGVSMGWWWLGIGVCCQRRR